MTKQKAEKVIEVLNEIASDMERDATELDGKPFNGRTVAEQFGNQGAAIKALATALALVIAELPADPHWDASPRGQESSN